MPAASSTKLSLDIEEHKSKVQLIQPEKKNKKSFPDLSKRKKREERIKVPVKVIVS